MEVVGAVGAVVWGQAKVRGWGGEVQAGHQPPVRPSARPARQAQAGRKKAGMCTAGMAGGVAQEGKEGAMAAARHVAARGKRRCWQCICLHSRLHTAM